jgi:hypothetical protein
MNPAAKLIALACALWLGASCAQVRIGRAVLGSGEPGTTGLENASAVANDIYHAPQYLPGSPTAATIYPRVLELPCHAAEGETHCAGYNWSPRMGRAEYLFFTPVPVPAVPLAMVQPVEPPAQADPVPVPAVAPASDLVLTRSIAPLPEKRERPKQRAGIKRDRQ